MSANASSAHPKYLPTPGTPAYHVMLICISILILGPLTAVTALYMNLSLGTFIPGQLLAGILGSVVTFRYGPDGRHGANYMQSLAASVSSMAGLGVLLQAMVWLGMTEPPTWKLVLYFLAIGMLGVGIGMMYTPLLVDRMQLTYPSGLAVANILRALSDPKLLRASIGKLAGGTIASAAATFFEPGPKIAEAGFFTRMTGAIANAGYPKVAAELGATVGGFALGPIAIGMIVSARIALSAVVFGIVGTLLHPTFVAWGVIGPNDPFRKATFIVALGMIMGAASIDVSLVLVSFFKRLSAGSDAKKTDPPSQSGGLTQRYLAMWVLGWGAAVVVIGSQILHVTPGFLIFAVALAFVFVLVNGISVGITDSNPISSAFVLSVILMAALGLRDPQVGLMAASILLIAASTGCDMQQDRSTGWRLGSDRTLQFRYQVIGLTMGAVLAVILPALFLKAYPVLKVDAFSHPDLADGRWHSTMTYKFVGALRALTNPGTWQTKFLFAGIGIGFVTEALRKLIKRNDGYKRFASGSQAGKTTDFLVDTVFLPSPYASSFGGFLDLPTSIWYGLGGVVTSVWNSKTTKVKTDSEKGAVPGEGATKNETPEDMGTMSLIGGGLIAGESLAMLAIGMYGLYKLAG